MNFVNQLAIDAGIQGKLGHDQATACRRKAHASSTRPHMLHNDACPNITVNPQTFDVMIDGKVITCEPAKVVPLAQRYMLR